MKYILFFFTIMASTMFFSCVNKNQTNTDDAFLEDSCYVEDETTDYFNHGGYLYRFLSYNHITGDDVGAVCVLQSESYWSDDESITIPYYIDGNFCDHKYIKKHVFNNDTVKTFLLKSAETDDSLNMCIDYLRENSLALRLVIDEVCFDAYDPDLMAPNEVKEFENYQEEVRRFFKKDANKIVTVNF